MQLSAGTNFAPYFKTTQSNQWGPDPTLHLGDFNGDGNKDLLWVQGDGRAFVQLWVGANFAPYFEITDSGVYSHGARLFVTDLNADRADDLLWIPQALGPTHAQLWRGSNFSYGVREPSPLDN